MNSLARLLLLLPYRKEKSEKGLHCLPIPFGVREFILLTETGNVQHQKVLLLGPLLSASVTGGKSLISESINPFKKRESERE